MTAATVKTPRSRRFRKHHKARVSQSVPAGLFVPRRISRHVLLAGASVMVMMLTAGQNAQAGHYGNPGQNVSATVNAANAAIQSAQQAAALTQQSMQSMARATQALQSMQAVQNAARNAALGTPSSIPNGLNPGGMVPDSGLAGSGVANPVTSWVGAKTPTQSSSGGQTTVTIQQTQQKAILNWSSFNIGRDTTAYFNQSAGNAPDGTNGWIALNRINDPSGVPSQILGQIRAEGSVYLINRNGIMFGGSSQVNVNTLIASSLNLFSNDLATSNARFLNGGIGDLNAANFATNSILLTTDAPGAGAVTVAPGAAITVGNQGFALIGAPNVTNSGVITAPGGQVALVAGIGVSYDYNKSSFNPNNSNNPQGTNDNSTTNLRFANYGKLTDGSGNDITPVGTLINDGMIFTPRGNITLLGGAIQQNGLAIATTSVAQPGSIVIESLYEVGANGGANPADEASSRFYTGSISFGPNAVTSILADSNGAGLPSDPASLARFQSQPAGGGFTAPLPTQGPGLIEIIGQAIDFKGGTLVYAPGQAIAASTVVLQDPRAGVSPVAGSGRILLESGAILDVSGIPGTVLTVDSNLLTVKLAGNELADSPLQRDGFLFGSTITVDMGNSGINPETGEPWMGTPLANLASYANLVQRSINQLLVNGGSIFLSSNEMIGAPGSIINLTGGYVDYLGGMIRTTVLVGADGRNYGIGSADPNMTYIGIAGQFTVDHSHWGIKENWTSSLINSAYYQPEYIQGGNAGLLSIIITGANGVANSGAAILNSTILASAFAGQRQISGGALPDNGTFNFNGIEPIEIGDPDTMSAAALAALSVPAAFTQNTPLLNSPGSAYATNVFSTQMLNEANFKNISLTAGGTNQPFQSITEDAGAALSVLPGGSISLNGNAITINGALIARGGAINITSTPVFSGSPASVPGDIVIGSTAVLDVSGFFINDSQLSPDEQSPALPINAGSIKLIAKAGVSEGNNIGGIAPDGNAVDLSGNITLAAGSLLDLRGGGHVMRNGQLQLGSNGVPLGSGGNLTIETYAGWESPLNSAAPLPKRGILVLDGTIDALGFNGGGTLTLEQAAFQIGGDAASKPSYATYFDPAHWGDLGFASLNLISLLESKVPDGAIVHLHHRNLVVEPNATSRISEATDPAAFASPGYLTGTQRSPTNFSVSAGLEQKNNPLNDASGSDDTARVGLGAEILGEPGSSISISSYGGTIILGTITAPGGNVSLAVNRSILNAGLTGPLYLGPQSLIDVSGTTIINPAVMPVTTANGLVTPLTGKILPGGTVSLSADQSQILVAPGSIINVSGASGAFDTVQLAAYGSQYLVRQPVWSDAGNVNLSVGTQSGTATLLFEGTLIANRGAPHANGGTLLLSGPAVTLVEDVQQALRDAGNNIDLTVLPPVQTGLNLAVAKVATGTLLFGANTLDGSGFDNLVVNGGFGFTGQVTLNLNNSVVLNGGGISAANQGNYISFNNLPTIGGNRTTVGPNGLAASLVINAPYIAVSGDSGNITSSFPNVARFLTTGDATLTLNANYIDIGAISYLQNIAQATYNSSGDIRLLPAQVTMLGYLATTGNLAFNAAEIYPATGAGFVIQSTSATGTITFGYPQGVEPSDDTPLSAGGTLLVSAVNIVQNGQILAPFGQIILGTVAGRDGFISGLGIDALTANNFVSALATQSVTLNDGSITSVSANGAIIPFGNTVDQSAWIYNPAANNPQWYSSGTTNTSGTTPLTQAPQGVITLNGASVSFQPGAKVNISGGGDLRAQEWIPGTGGSRDVLSQFNISYINSAAGTQVPLFPDAREIYAIVPGYSAKIAPFDANMSQSGLVPGQQIYLSGGPGLPAGYYTLLPAKYATLPGAFRVVVNSGVTNPVSNQTVTLPDGTMNISGYFGNSLTGSRDASISQFFVQPESVWGRYSQYAITSANSFFPTYAANNNQAAPYVPNDAGRLVLSAISGLTLGGTLIGDAGPGGAGSQVDISSRFIQITGKTQAIDAGYLGIDAAMLNSLGADSILIGGTRKITLDGTVITPTANGVIISNDASDPLVAPEILLVAKPQFQNTTIQIDSQGHTTTILAPVANTGLVTIRSGSVVQAVGDHGNSRATKLILGSTLSNLLTQPDSTLSSLWSTTGSSIANYYALLSAALGTVVQVSNGPVDTIQLPSQSQISPGQITIIDSSNPSNPAFTLVLPSFAGAAGGTGAVIESGAHVGGGNVLTLASTGDVRVQSGAELSAKHFTAFSSNITVLGNGSGAAPTTGMVIDAVTLAQLEQSQSVNLQSYGNINFQGNVDIAMEDAAASLTLGGAAIASDGGTTKISAATLVLDHELGTAIATPGTGAGILDIEVGQLVFGTGNKTLTGFGNVSLIAHEAVIGQGTGSFDFGSLPVTLQTPIVIADTASDQTIKTTGAMSVVSLAGPALVSDALGGAITLQGGTVTVSAPVQALAGNITLAATNGDATVTGVGSLIAHGIAKQFVDVIAFASGGTIKLKADHGTVNIEAGAVVDFAGAALGGNGGGLSITTTNSTAPIVFNGTLLGSSAAGYNGSVFSLDTSGPANLDSLARIISAAGINGGISVHSKLGDLVLSDTSSLIAPQVLLVADGGNLIVNGTIDASGRAGGTIQLYGTGIVAGDGSVTGGVTVNGRLIARASDSDQLGGIVEIGTSGQFDPATGTYNTSYGYENIAAGKSGTITLGANAFIDVSGGTRGSVSGGTVLLRAPLLDDGRVNVVLPAAFAVGRGIVGARSVSLESYAVWSTADATTGTKHFDGIVDPSGWYNSSGALLSGSFTNNLNVVVATWDSATGTLINQDGTANDLAYYLANNDFKPTNANGDHATFYGWVNGDSTAALPGTVMGFIENTNLQPVANSGGISNFVQTTGVDLVNPVSANVNNGNISVLTNWNLGAKNANGDSVFRHQGNAPVVSLRAGGDLKINASISDGFVQSGAMIASVPPVPAAFDTYSNILTLYSGVSARFSSSAYAQLSYLTQNLMTANGLTFDSFAIQMPLSPADLGSSGVYDQYYGSWKTYQLRYNIFNTRLTTSTFTSAYSPTGLTPQSTLTDSRATAAMKTAATNLINAKNLLDSRASFTDQASYGLYLTQYLTYATNYALWANAVRALTIATLVRPPLAPPRVSVAFTLPISPPSYIQANSPDVMATAANQAAITGMAVSNEVASTSYRLVAGADLSSGNPLALGDMSGSVSLDGHTFIRPTTSTNFVLVNPTTVRTGTGSIDVAASADFKLLDQIAPGVIYTAGVAPTAPTGDSSIASGAGALRSSSLPNNTGISTLLTAVSNPDNAGNITVTVQGNIVGFQNVIDTLADFSSTASGLSSNPGMFVGQFWSPWLLSSPANPNVPWYVNFGSFDQGIMSVGGNVTVRAGGDIRDLSVSLPTTAWLDGSRALHITGGGNLSVSAGGSIYSGSFYVGNGQGTIRSGGAIASDFNVVNLGQAYSIPTLLAVQYGNIDVEARQSAEIGGVYNPTYLGTSVPSFSSATASVNLSPYVTSMNADGGVSIQSNGGSLLFNSVLPGFAGINSYLLPASLSLIALDGSIAIEHGGGLYPSTTGTLTVLADQSVNLSIPLIVDSFGARLPTLTAQGNVSATSLGKLDFPVGTGILPTATNPTILFDATQLTPAQVHDPAMVAYTGEPVRIYALNGSIIDGITVAVGSLSDTGGVVGIGGTAGQVSLVPNAPAQIYSGLDVVDLPFYGENFRPSDVTSIVAGRDIRYNIKGNRRPAAIELAGPGFLVVQAGRNISFQAQADAAAGTFGLRATETGIRTIGNSIDNLANPDGLVARKSDLSFLPNDFGNPYLPPGGASVSVLFGVGPGMDQAAFINQYINPANAAALMPSSQDALISFVSQYEIASGNAANVPQTIDQAWAIFQALPAARQRLLVEQVFIGILNATGLDFNDPASPFSKQYERGYQAINTLFPARLGYTANNLGGGTNGANQLVHTGDFDMRSSTVQTQQGGNISMFGPGGRILVGSSVARPAVNPASEGILTLENGNISTFTDGDVLVAQSRIMTEQGGDIVMWTSNGNLDAGKGAKTSVSAPPPKFACDIDWICGVDIKGVVSGAGIATLQSLPDSPLGDFNLIAPRGSVDFGAAGGRSSGNANVAALVVLNSFNVTVQGTTTGIPTVQAPPVAALTNASNTTAATQQGVAPQSGGSKPASVWMVEIIGYGGSQGSDQDDNDERKKTAN